MTELAVSYPDRLGLIVTPRNANGPTYCACSGLPWAIDNGAWSGFNEKAFVRLLDRASGQPGLLWAVAPDVVADAKQTLAQWPWWVGVIRSRGIRAAFVLQDGQEEMELPEADAFFVGGSTGWKLSQAACDLIGECHRRGRYVHVGRVNTQQRLQWAFDLKVDSVDGSIFSRMSDKFLLWGLRFLDRLENQPVLFKD